MEVVVVLIVVMMVTVDVMVHGGGCGGEVVVTMASNTSLTFFAEVSVDSWWAEAEIWQDTRAAVQTLRITYSYNCKFHLQL